MAILHRFFQKMLVAGILCICLLIFGLFLGKFILSSYVWYGTERIYPLIHWISDHQKIFVVFMFLICLLGIGIFYWAKLLNYFQEVLDAMEDLTGEEKLIRLRPQLQEVQQYMNEIQMQNRRNEQNAREAEQRKNDLVVYLAHDLKTPLTSVIGYLTLLKEERQISPELQEKYLSISLKKAERLEDLINEFFEITRFNLTHLELEKSVISLNMLLEQTVFEFEPVFKEKNLTCRLALESEHMMIACDPEKLQRVFDNLLRNAVLYSQEGTEIQIRAEGLEKSRQMQSEGLEKPRQIQSEGSKKPKQVQREGQEKIVQIQVENRGTTIPKEKLERIFEQFYRLDRARQSKSGGAGLGLAIAKEIVRLHDGRIYAKSGQEVTIFTVELPLIQQV
ncbi:MAG: vancomycin resistance histidine kinase VanS [Lachnospiraceae bacterium]|nr:vancomycin resistance histidine kinase VanS [Lachnospiraceae bacterium]